METQLRSSQIQLQNYMKLQFLINTTATTCLRQMFMAEWHFTTKQTWKNLPADGMSFISRFGEKVHKQSQKLQKGLLSSGNLDRWDIPLLAAAIKSLPPSSSTTMSATTRKQVLDVLKEQRNKLAHHGSTIIPDDQFELIWKAVTRVLLQFGVPAAELDQVRNISFGSSANQKKLEDVRKSPGYDYVFQLIRLNTRKFPGPDKFLCIYY